MNIIALHASSFVGKPSGYRPDNRWEDCVRTMQDYYRPLETFAERFDNLVRTVQGLGYDAMDVWQTGQLEFRWATDEHVHRARELLARHNMTLTSYAGEFGDTRQEFRDACKVARGIGAPLLSGTTPLLLTDRAFVVATLDEFDIKLAFENHPERSAQELLDKLGDGGGGRVGTAVDTGWYAAWGYDVVRAIHELGDHIFHIHLKDVLAGEPDVNVGHGKGIVPLEGVVRASKEIGYRGVYSVEEHTLDHDPTEELRTALPMVRQWLA